MTSSGEAPSDTPNMPVLAASINSRILSIRGGMIKYLSTTRTEIGVAGNDGVNLPIVIFQLVAENPTHETKEFCVHGCTSQSDSGPPVSSLQACARH